MSRSKERVHPIRLTDRRYRTVNWADYKLTDEEVEWGSLKGCNGHVRMNYRGKLGFLKKRK